MNNAILFEELLQGVPSAPNAVVHVRSGSDNPNGGFELYYSGDWDTYVVTSTVTTTPVRLTVTTADRLVLTTWCQDWQDCESNIELVAWDIERGLVFYSLERDAGYEGIPAYCHILWDSLPEEERPPQQDRWIVEGLAKDGEWHWQFAGDKYDWCTMETEAAAEEAWQSLVEDCEIDPETVRYRKLPERAPLGVSC